MKKYFVFIFALTFLFFSYLPNLYEAYVADLLPADRMMILGEHIYTYDYNVYLSKIRQGQEGRRTVVDKYDNHPDQKGVFLQMFYLLTGKLTAPLRISPASAFHLLRTIFSLLWIYTIIWLSVFFLKKPVAYSLGVVASLLTTGFPVFYRFENQWWVKSHMDWWQEMDIMKRISFLPHDTVNYIVISLLTICLFLFDKTENKKYFILICLILFFSLFIHPSAAIVFFFSWTVFYLIKYFWFKSIRPWQLMMIGLKTMIMFFIILIPLFYFRLATSTYPWKSLTEFDRAYRLTLNIKEYILALGPIFFTGIVGAVLVLVKKQKRLLSVVTWFLGAFVCIFLFKLYPDQSELRFVQTANHIPLAILSVWLFSEIWQKYRSSFMKILVVITVIIIILNGVIQSYFSLKAQNQFIHQRAVATLPLVPAPPQVMYPLKDFYNALKWLESHSSRSSVVFSKYTAGNYIPAYSGNFVYLGHNPESSHFEEKSQKVEQFFSGIISPAQARQFFWKEKIDYVFYGPQEKENYQLPMTNYQFLIPVYQTPHVTIYEFK